MAKKKQSSKKIVREDIFVSVIVGARAEYDSLDKYITELSELLASKYENYEIIVIDNALSAAVIQEVVGLLSELPCIRLIRLSREYSYDTALMAGIQGAIGDYVVLVNPSLDPISEIPAMVEENKTYDIVNGVAAVAETTMVNAGIGRRLFYWYNRRQLGVNIPANATYFIALSRRAVRSVATTNRHDGHIRHLIRQIGYSCVEHEYETKEDPARSRGLKTGVLEAIDVVTSHSTQPLRFMSWIGVAASVINLLYAIYVVCVALFKQDIAAGWTTMSLQLSSMFFLLFMFMVILAEYIGKILKEARNDAPYIVMDELSSIVSIADTKRKNLSE